MKVEGAIFIGGAYYAGESVGEERREEGERYRAQYRKVSSGRRTLPKVEQYRHANYSNFRHARAFPLTKN